MAERLIFLLRLIYWRPRGCAKRAPGSLRYWTRIPPSAVSHLDSLHIAFSNARASYPSRRTAFVFHGTSHARAVYRPGPAFLRACDRILRAGQRIAARRAEAVRPPSRTRPARATTNKAVFSASRPLIERRAYRPQRLFFLFEVNVRA